MKINIYILRMKLHELITCQMIKKGFAFNEVLMDDDEINEAVGNYDEENEVVLEEMEVDDEDAKISMN